MKWTNVLKKYMQKNFNKIPKNILAKIDRIKSNNLIVACVKKIKINDIKSRKYNKLGIYYKNGDVKFEDSFLPDPAEGKYSQRNTYGEEKKRRDLPKYQKTFSFEAPNYGDSSKGMHTVEWTKEIYHKDFLPPKEIKIKIELLENSSKDFYLFKFYVDEVLNKNDKEFEYDLLYDINLLQENVGFIDVFDETTTREDYIKTITINWEILPQGERDEVIDLIISKFKNPSPRTVEIIKDRYDLISSFNPIFIIGTSGFRRYLGAKLKDDLIIFENLEYGNAIYIMFEDWKELSKLSRLELLKDRDNKRFERIVHVGNWKERLTNIIKENLTNNV